MERKKLIIFLLLAFLPMVGNGIAIYFLDGSQASTYAKSIVMYILTSGAMFIPMLAVIITQLIYKERLFSGIEISFNINRWWFIGWLLTPLIAMAVVGVTLLMPEAQWAPIEAVTKSMPEELGTWGLIAVSLLSGLFAGITINAVFAFGEEVAWRGFLVKEFKGMKFLYFALFSGIIWGFWHAPLILNGHNYSQHSVIGIFMMVVFCVLFTPILMYFRQKSGTVIVPAIIHGTFNGVAGLSMLLIYPVNDLLYGATGLAGFIVLFIVDLSLYLYDRFISRENIFSSLI